MGQFQMMIEGRLEEDRRQRALAAARVCATIHGMRDKRPSLRGIFNRLVGGKSIEDPNVEFADMLAESRARVAAAKRAAAAEAPTTPTVTGSAA